jgi:hypothetical protein
MEIQKPSSSVLRILTIAEAVSIQIRQSGEWREISEGAILWGCI